MRTAQVLTLAALWGVFLWGAAMSRRAEECARARDRAAVVWDIPRAAGHDADRRLLTLYGAVFRWSSGLLGFALLLVWSR